MSRRLGFSLVLVLVAFASVAARAEGGAQEGLRLNDVQARGTHNSYHRDPKFPGRDADQLGWDYSRKPLPNQFEEQDVRQVELDVHYNWARDDFEVYHAWFADDRTTCELLSECLALLRSWSDAHPTAHPIAVLIEPKDAGPPKNTELPENGDPFTRPFTAAEYDKLDRVLFDAFGGALADGGRVITPDDVTTAGKTLRDSITTDGWPLLDTLRGDVLYLLDGSDHAEPYSDGWTSLAGRAMFVQAEPEQAVAAFVGRDGARLAGEDKYGRMQRLVAQGFMVRDLVSPSEFDVAKAAGAHFLSTDAPDELILSASPGAPSRCNPVTTVARSCDDLSIETHAHTPGYEPPPDTTSDETDQVLYEKADRLVVRSVESAAEYLGLPSGS
ncbi:MAG: Ca2+-dependent phosphoinositide-specific phospholipase C [Actinomycetota bacterium]